MILFFLGEHLELKHLSDRRGNVNVIVIVQCHLGMVLLAYTPNHLGSAD
jgi:hypothetical protein